MRKNDTIAALCTAPGGALAIIRISGPDALEASKRVWTSRKPLSPENPRVLTFGHTLREDGVRGETCMAVFMPGPASYTGEDVVEIQCHGGEYAPRALLERIFRTGLVRCAEPGEFTRRAFLNGKLDLTQAEAVADLISAKSESAGRLAERQLSGALGDRVRSISETLYHLLAEIESRLDFPEENLDWKPCDELLATVDTVRAELAKLLSGRESSAILRDGVRLVIAGSPNVGKSSLLNRLLGYDR
ncbi:MAG: GTPase, partial [Victivallales bacterium]|nr:GTPase [Victivallales bacterium]